VSARLLSVGDHPGADLRDPEGLLEQRFDGRRGTVYLIRPDQHVAARWRAFDAAKIRAALARCLAA
jgi:3-(3-hydroxy-phenyl)propionate hydroxylase